MISPFNDISPSAQHKLYDLLGTHIYKYNKNEEMLYTLKSKNIIAIVTKGSAQIIYSEYNGNEIVLEDLQKDSIFGSNISEIGNENCQIIAKEYTELLVIDYNTILNPNNLRYSYFNTFLKNLFEITNTKFKENNERMRILEKKQLRDKLLEYFDIQYRKTRSRTINLPFNLKDLADYLAVNRSAMFRELKNLKEDRLIEVNGKKIVLLYR